MSAVLRVSWCWLVLAALTSGCASTTSSVLPCVREVQLVEVEVPVSQPVTVPEELRWPELPEHPRWPGSGCSEAELEAWAIETARVAREREEALAAVLEACLEYLAALKEPSS